MANRVGITGHRDLRNFDHARLTADIRRELSALAQEHAQRVMLSSLAAGADQLCAGIGLDLGYQLIVLLPFAGFRDGFTGDGLMKFDSLLNSAKQTIIVSTNQNADVAYLEAGKYVADHCDVLLAVWDGEAQTSQCGTQAVIEYAKKINRKVTIIKPDR
ncbi:MAG: DUF1273 family protein [Clostridiales bacterium]|nr:DUF1273 family protein [Clostridiales bacterium]